MTLSGENEFRYFSDGNTGLSFIYTTNWKLDVSRGVYDRTVQVFNDDYVISYRLVPSNYQINNETLKGRNEIVILENENFKCIVSTKLPKRYDYRIYKEIKRIIGSARLRRSFV